LVVLCVVSLGGGGKGGGGGGGGGLFPTPHTNNTGGQKNADSGTSKTRNSVTFTFVDGDSSNSHSHGHSHGHGHGQQSHGQARRQSQSLRQSLGESDVGGDGADLHEQEQQEQQQHVHHIHHQEIGLHNAADITAAARLAAASVEALPDFDQTAAAKEAKLHLNPKRLLLDNPKSLHLFGELSEGEKVLALHKTFYHMEDSLSVSCCCCCCCIFSLCFDFPFLVLSFCFAVFWQTNLCFHVVYIYVYMYMGQFLSFVFLGYFCVVEMIFSMYFRYSLFSVCIMRLLMPTGHLPPPAPQRAEESLFHGSGRQAQ
jgi:hypothetical protein